MADTKISALTEATTIDSGDLIPIVDTSDTTQAASGTTKQIDYDNFLNKLQSTSAMPNLLENGNFINNSTDGYGGTSDDWTSSNGNEVQGGFTVNADGLDKAGLIDLLGITDGDIEGLWFLNEASGDATDYSSNGYDLTDNNTVGSSDDGLIGKARDFEASNSEYLSIADASCANLEMSGSQTWFAFVKPESPGTGSQYILDKESASAEKWLRIDNTSGGTNYIFGLTGLTQATVSSSVVAQSGKWHFVVCVYDSSNAKLKIWINGIKTEEASSGSCTDTNGNFIIGRDDSAGDDYFDGLIQYAGVLSTALSDDQVKRFFAGTMYKSTKIRRATSDAILSQSLEQDKVERLRDKYVTLRARYSSDTESAPYISIDDGTDTESDAVVYTDQYGVLTLTTQIDSDATEVTVKLKHKDTDGSTWFEEVALYEGHTAFPYAHGPEDWNRFPRLLRMDMPAVVSGYEFEENRQYEFLSAWTADTTDPTIGNGSQFGYFSISGNKCSFFQSFNFGSTTNFGSNDWHFTIPVLFSENTFLGDGQAPTLSVVALDAGTAWRTGLARGDLSNRLEIVSSGVLGWDSAIPHTWASTDKLTISGSYQID